MNFKQLRAFREVMQARSISEAARRLNRTQPAISGLISGLENQLGLKLFDRQGMRLHPLPEAYYLLKEASKILDNLENAKRTMQNVRNLEQGELNIICMPGPSIFFMPDLIDYFLNKHSKVKVSLTTKTSGNIERLISAQQYNLGFADIYTQDFEKNSLTNYQFFPIPCMCALNKNDPLCKKTKITPEDLHQKPLAVLHSEHSTRQQTEKAFTKANADFIINFEAQYFIPLLTFVERDRACAIVDALTVESYRLYRLNNSEIEFRPFVPNIFINTAILTPNQFPASRLTKEFLKLLGGKLGSFTSVDKNSPI